MYGVFWINIRTEENKSISFLELEIDLTVFLRPISSLNMRVFYQIVY